MSVTLNASTSSGLVQTADTSGTIQLQSNGTTRLTVASTGVTIGGTFGGSVITSGTLTASTSGTSIDFTSIPSWVKKITVMLSGVSLSGTAYLAIQLGDSGGIENSGYLGGSGNTGGGTVANSTFFSLAPSSTAAATANGLYTIALMDSATNLWSISGNAYQTGHSMSLCGGSKPLSATLDRLRITTSNGTDTFDAGSINILYEG
jgi:hypothetical protein